MTFKFIWGNIFIDEKIEEAEPLKNALGLSSWKPSNPEDIWNTLNDKKSQIEEQLNGKVDISLIVYADGEACVDFYVTEEDEDKEYRGTCEMDPELWKLWERYSKRMFDNVQNRMSYKQDMVQGHFFSDDEVLREIEDRFIDLVPKHI